MNELRQMFTVSYEYAVGELERVIGDGGAPLSCEDMEMYAYWEGQRDAYQRAVDMLNRQIVAEDYAESVQSNSGEVL